MKQQDFLSYHSNYRPEAPAALELSTGRAWTFRSLEQQTARCVTALANRGVKQGGRVACLSKNRVSLVMLHLACARLGAIYVPLNWRWSAVEISAVLDDLEPDLVLGDEQLATVGVDGISLDEFEIEITRSPVHPSQTIVPDLPSLILYSSGTSGRPKGVLLSERNLLETALNFGWLGHVTPNSAFLCDAPMFHVIGLISNIRPALVHGACFVVSEGFNPPRTIARMADRDLRISHYFCVPQMAEALRSDPGFDPAGFAGLTALFTGGAPHPSASINRWLDDGVIVADGFGMSEAGTVFGMPLDPALIRERAGSAGIATPRVSARIVDAEERVTSLGEAGELQIKGDNLFKSYWRRPDETAAAFTADGWFRTGDIAIADQAGFHWIVDRKKDMFISGGENVYPAEIEAALAAHDAIAECAVVGVPDLRWGEVGHLFAVRRPGLEPQSQDILDDLSALIARYKLPKYVTWIDALPRSGAGKVLKEVLRNKHQENNNELE